ncbi:molybdenum cofactor cytidylyltransferase [Aquamicrobium defluvii]|uniref:Molybdenum cofactor cytidylyltransferase n=2 Tax=Aquamicrobium defluvii TaxID=69279 RepID=A0A4R6YDV0_9HYPH|nr:molybdenum cofactor cytidylyltransferase [Aquamicrobium defluvii]
MTMQIERRPRSRDPISVAIILLAAGRASRMGVGGTHKLLAEFAGVPLVRRSAERAISSGANSVTVVTGYRHEEIQAALDGLDLDLAHNPDFASGMASSLKRGFGASKPRRADGVLVMLADMPDVTAGDLTTLISAFRTAGGHAVVRAASQGKRGNPVILPQSLHEEVTLLEGDVGARQIIESCGLAVIEVEIGDGAVLDVDTPEAVIAAGGVLK